MANHVSAHLRVQTISEEGQKVWNSFVCEKLEAGKREGEWEVHLGHYLFECDESGEFTDWDFNKMCEEVGAKWAYATDWDVDFVSCYSAWSPVLEWAEMVAKKIGEVDPSVELVMTYEDEMPNFVGVATFDKDGMDTDNTLEHDEILEMVLNDHEDIRDCWDEENYEWKEDREDEGLELLWEVQYDVINEWQENNIDWSIK